MLTFVQIKASNLGLQGNLQAVQALNLIALRGLMSWTSSGKYLHFLTNGSESFFVCCWDNWKTTNILTSPCFFVKTQKAEFNIIKVPKYEILSWQHFFITGFKKLRFFGTDDLLYSNQCIYLCQNLKHRQCRKEIHNKSCFENVKKTLF